MSNQCKWKLQRSGPRDNLRWVVQVLDDNQHVLKYETRRYQHGETALCVADALNKQGENVQVLCEHAYCTREEA